MDFISRLTTTECVSLLLLTLLTIAILHNMLRKKNEVNMHSIGTIEKECKDFQASEAAANNDMSKQIHDEQDASNTYSDAYDERESISMRNYSSWTTLQATSLMILDRKSEGVGLRYQSGIVLNSINFSGISLVALVKDLSHFSVEESTDRLQQKFGLMIPREECALIVKWVKRKLMNPIGSVKIPKHPFNFNHSAKFIEVVGIMMKEFESFCQSLESNRKLSLDLFNERMRSIDCENLSSPILLLNIDGSCLEEPKSSQYISCDLAATFPSDKYDGIVKALFRSQDPYNVVVLIEAPGAGKTHLCYHLTGLKKMVLPITSVLCKYLFVKISRARSAPRDVMDKMFKQFLLTYLNIAKVLFLKTVNQSTLSPNMILIYLLKFFWNGGATTLRELLKTALESNGEELVNVEIPSWGNMDHAFILDEAQILTAHLPGMVSSTNSKSYLGNALTLITSGARTFAPVILTSTFVKCIEQYIESSNAQAPNKLSKEIFSYELSTTLPPMHALQVVPFLSMFIRTNNDDSPHSIWNLVSIFLQGTFRNAEDFLWRLFCETESRTTNKETSLTNAVYRSLNRFMQGQFINMKKNSLSNDRRLKSKRKLKNTEALFLRLALLGEATFSLSDQKTLFSRYLMKNGVTYTFEYCKNHHFKIVSPIEKAKLLTTIHFKKVFGTFECMDICQTKKDYSQMSQIAMIYFLLYHFNSFVESSSLSGTYLTEFSLKAEYFMEDLQISELSNNLGMSLSSLLVHTIYRNMNGFNDDNNPYPFSEEDSLLSKFIIRPPEFAGPDVLGMLVRRSNNACPNIIPLSMSVTAQTSIPKLMKDYLRTDISMIYSEKKNIQANSVHSVSFVEKEKQFIAPAIKEIVQQGKILRIIAKPNALETTSLRDRIIQEYEPENYVTEEDRLKLIEVSKWAVITKEGNIVYEICDSNQEWCDYLEKNELQFLKNFFNTSKLNP
ncbi:hypothetical protein C9374_012740 [Naegleria lovaniensis]|uniref:Uncharacterized protein n=1 Tax=Naegleria lovaniensis TaxID=51637 RepID=A0AA88H0D5_NAELO|nr:uncharacterized protein C9374_012740 [Naegleria lovaniensis]KAG2392488.1 hypothetical protein C9374_012740 [Naegleria lovaniensis]